MNSVIEFFCNYGFSLVHIDGLLENSEAEVKILQEKHAFKRAILRISQVYKP